MLKTITEIHAMAQALEDRLDATAPQQYREPAERAALTRDRSWRDSKELTEILWIEALRSTWRATSAIDDLRDILAENAAAHEKKIADRNNDGRRDMQISPSPSPSSTP